jgi:hypothetical protein
MADDLQEYFMWLEIDPNGGEGAIAIAMPEVGNALVALIARNRQIAEGPMRKLAVAHQKASGHRVRLVRWSQREDLEELK